MVTDTIEAGLQTELEGVRDRERESSETARQSDRMDE